MKKYELTSEYVEFDGRKLYRIKALKSFYLCGLTVKAGALGGYIEKEENLSQEGNAWIHGNDIFTIMPMFVITHISARKHGFMEMLKLKMKHGFTEMLKSAVTIK